MVRSSLNECAAAKTFCFLAKRSTAAAPESASSFEASMSMESQSKIELRLEKEKLTARQQKFVRAPKTAMRRFQLANIEQTL